MRTRSQRTEGGNAAEPTWPGADVKVETRGTRAGRPEGGRHSGVEKVPEWEPASSRGAQTIAHPSPGAVPRPEPTDKHADATHQLLRREPEGLLVADAGQQGEVAGAGQLGGCVLLVTGGRFVLYSGTHGDVGTS